MRCEHLFQIISAVNRQLRCEKCQEVYLVLPEYMRRYWQEQMEFEALFAQ